MSPFTRRAVMLGTAAVAASAVMPVAAMPICRPAITVPAGWLLCNFGAEIARAEYPILYDILAEKYRILPAHRGDFPLGLPSFLSEFESDPRCHYIIRAEYADDELPVNWPVGSVIRYADYRQ